MTLTAVADRAASAGTGLAATFSVGHPSTVDAGTELARLRTHGWTDQHFHALIAVFPEMPERWRYWTLMVAGDLSDEGVAPGEAIAWVALLMSNTGDGAVDISPALQRWKAYREARGDPYKTAVRLFTTAAGGDHALARLALQCGLRAGDLAAMVEAGTADPDAIRLLGALTC